MRDIRKKWRWWLSLTRERWIWMILMEKRSRIWKSMIGKLRNLKNCDLEISFYLNSNNFHLKKHDLKITGGVLWSKFFIKPKPIFRQLPPELGSRLNQLVIEVKIAVMDHRLILAFGSWEEEECARSLLCKKCEIFACLERQFSMSDFVIAKYFFTDS